MEIRGNKLTELVKTTPVESQVDEQIPAQMDDFDSVGNRSIEQTSILKGAQESFIQRHRGKISAGTGAAVAGAAIGIPGALLDVHPAGWAILAAAALIAGLGSRAVANRVIGRGRGKPLIDLRIDPDLNPLLLNQVERVLKQRGYDVRTLADSERHREGSKLVNVIGSQKLTRPDGRKNFPAGEHWLECTAGSYADNPNRSLKDHLISFDESTGEIQLGWFRPDTQRALNQVAPDLRPFWKILTTSSK